VVDAAVLVAPQRGDAVVANVTHLPPPRLLLGTHRTDSNPQIRIPEGSKEGKREGKKEEAEEEEEHARVGGGVPCGDWRWDLAGPRETTAGAPVGSQGGG